MKFLELKAFCQKAAENQRHLSPLHFSSLRVRIAPGGAANSADDLLMRVRRLVAGAAGWRRGMKRKFDAKLFDNPPRPQRGSVLVFDTKATGLAMRVSAKGTPALQIVARDPEGIERRVTFASVVPHGALTPDGRKLDLDGIRTEAVAVRDLVRRGQLLTTARPLAGCGGITLSEAVDLHVSGRVASGKLQGRAADEYRHST